MADQSIIIKATAGDKTISTSLTNVNPEATNAQMIELAQKFNALTTNTLSDVSKVVKTALKSKTTPEFLVRRADATTDTPFTSEITFTRQEVTEELSDANLKYNGDGKYYIKANDTLYTAKLSYMPNNTPAINRYMAHILPGLSTSADPGEYCDINNPSRELPYSGTVIIGVTETDSYEPAEVKIHITSETNRGTSRGKGGTVNG